MKLFTQQLSVLGTCARWIECSVGHSMGPQWGLESYGVAREQAWVKSLRHSVRLLCRAERGEPSYRRTRGPCQLACKEPRPGTQASVARTYW